MNSENVYGLASKINRQNRILRATQEYLQNHKPKRMRAGRRGAALREKHHDLKLAENSTGRNGRVNG